jgi:L,D-transpeptidase catalytic domain
VTASPCARTERVRRPRPLAGALTVALAGLALVAATAAAASAPLSDRHTRSRWAYPMSEALVHASPSPGARAIGRLQFLTSDQQAELHLALASSTLASGQTWLQIELPGRPNGATGWVPADALGPLHAVRGYLLIDRRALRATLYRGGRAIFSVPVGVGQPGTITPPGHFYVLEKLITVGDPAYGPYAIGTSAYAPTLSEWPGGGVVGIHGTNEPQLIPGRPSHGCVRMRNSDIARLWHLIAAGTPIEIT